MSEQQSMQLPPEVTQQFRIMQVRMTNADLANMDLRNEINALIQMLLNQINTLKKENAELSANRKNKQNLKLTKKPNLN